MGLTRPERGRGEMRRRWDLIILGHAAVVSLADRTRARRTNPVHLAEEKGNRARPAGG